MAATLKTLDELTSSDRDLVGSKAYNCGRLRQAAFPVPDGIVIPADVPDRCVREFADHEWFARQPADALFAVRSSGIGEDGEGYSFAGIHETHLNVPPAEVVEAVLVCRRSAASPQALAYRASRGLASDEPIIGVLVQRMVPARVSGVAFTVNPVTGGDELVINAAPGLGEALVSGQVVVMRDPNEFASMRRGAILVTRATDPSWTPLFTLASGVVVEVGGMLSHASTIAREYGLPALANVKQATERLRTGDRIRLDASGGRIHRLSRSPR
jgi:pyruvate,water dikinase